MKPQVFVKVDLALRVKTMGKLLALDQASKTSGYAIFDNDNLISYGLIKTKSSDIGERLVQFRQRVEQIIQDNNITEVIFEEIQLQENVGNNVATFKTLSEVMGVLVELLTELKIPYSSVLSGTWRKKLSIDGYERAVQKRNAQRYVSTKYSITASEDESDAICIGAYRRALDQKDFDWA